MATILDELAAYAKERTAKAMRERALSSLRADAEAMPKGDFAFQAAIMKQAHGSPAFICECKKASPSKGLIAPEFPYLQIAQDYEQAGADCISVLTEPRWFFGSDRYLQEIASTVSIPCLRKDFTVDPYMIYEAKTLGASAVLLICSILDEAQLRDFHALADDLGLSALVEAHDTHEIETAAKIGARIIGVNNRNLKDFTVDTGHAARLRGLCPADTLFVVESGIQTAADIAQARAAKADAVLIGETLMRARDKTAMFRQLKGDS